MYESYGLFIEGRWRVAEGIRERVDEIARLITLEAGKPLAESRAGGTFGIQEYLEAKTVKTVI